MNTKLIYFDESGDDGLKPGSSDYFILTGTIVDSLDWNETYRKIIEFRKQLKIDYGFHMDMEFHSKEFIFNRNMYRKKNWTKEERKEILKRYISLICSLKIKTSSVVVIKKNINTNKYKILENSLIRILQNIEKLSKNNYKYLIIADKGRIPSMKKIVSKCQIKDIKQIKNMNKKSNKYVFNMVEDLFDKDSKDSYYIQISDFIASFISLYFKYCLDNKSKLPKRILKTIDKKFISESLEHFKENNIIDISKMSSYDLFILP